MDSFVTRLSSPVSDAAESVSEYSSGCSNGDNGGDILTAHCVRVALAGSPFLLFTVQVSIRSTIYAFLIDTSCLESHDDGKGPVHKAKKSHDGQLRGPCGDVSVPSLYHWNLELRNVADRHDVTFD
ncbi:hypothetical protein VDGL01_02157 [Verticillium dahliae]